MKNGNPTNDDFGNLDFNLFDENFSDAISSFMNKNNSWFTTSFFSSLMNAFPDLIWCFVPKIADMLKESLRGKRQKYVLEWCLQLFKKKKTHGDNGSRFIPAAQSFYPMFVLAKENCNEAKHFKKLLTFLLHAIQLTVKYLGVEKAIEYFPPQELEEQLQSIHTNVVSVSGLKTQIIQLLE